MISLHSFLAETGDLVAKLPTIALVIAVVLVGIAFVIGFSKGFRKVSWDGVSWFVAGIAFVGIGYLTPLDGDNPLVDCVFNLLLAMVCAGGSFALFKFLEYLFRPRMRWIDDDINADTSLAEYGLEFEPEYKEYDGEHEYKPYGKRIYKTGYGEPSFFGRLLGGVISAINIGIVLWALCSAFLLIVGATPLKDLAIGGILLDESIAPFLENARNYCLDYLLIGIMIFIAKEGHSKGLISSLCSAVVWIGSIAAVALSFYLPFSQFAQEGVIADLIVKLSPLVAEVPLIGGVLGKLLVSVLLLAISVLVLIIVNMLLKWLSASIQSFSFTREIDGFLSAALYLVIGAVICVCVIAILAGFEAIGIFSVSQILGKRAFLSNGIFTYVQPIVVSLLGITQ